MTNKKVLLVEDDELTRILLSKMIENLGYQVKVADNVPDALHILQSEVIGVILSDIQMRPVSGLEFLQRLSGISPKPCLIYMTGKGSLSNAWDAISQGAFDYLGKPIQSEVLAKILERAFASQEAVSSFSEMKSETPDFGLIGKSPLMVEVYKNVARAAMCDSNVLIWGESGTGKELVAKAIHEHSSRKQNRFVTVNCGALTETLLESELFGHLKGSFTGAIANKKGLFEEANGGTLFLDEIGDISAGLQVKLLRVIQEGEFKPVGSVENRRVNVRIIAATHRNLCKMVEEEKFREDLFYRLKVLTLQLPPLRERKEDIIPLVQFFINRNAGSDRKMTLSRSAVDILLNYSWPGNIRELEHAIERAVAMAQGNVLFPQDLSLEAQVKSRTTSEDSQPNLPQGGIFPTKPFEEEMVSLEELEKRHIVKVIKYAHFNKTRAAQVLGIDRATLYRKAERYQISLGDKEEVSLLGTSEN